MSDDIEDVAADLAADGYMTAHVIPPVVETVRAATARLRGQTDPGWLASEVGLMRRNGIKPELVLIDTYERDGAEVRYAQTVLDAAGSAVIDRETYTEPVVVTEDVVRTLEVYP
jgi:hypothetical protein